MRFISAWLKRNDLGTGGAGLTPALRHCAQLVARGAAETGCLILPAAADDLRPVLPTAVLPAVSCYRAFAPPGEAVSCGGGGSVSRLVAWRMQAHPRPVVRGADELDAGGFEAALESLDCLCASRRHTIFGFNPFHSPHGHVGNVTQVLNRPAKSKAGNPNLISSYHCNLI